MLVCRLGVRGGQLAIDLTSHGKDANFFFFWGGGGGVGNLSLNTKKSSLPYIFRGISRPSDVAPPV